MVKLPKFAFMYAQAALQPWCPAREVETDLIIIFLVSTTTLLLWLNVREQ